MRRCARWGALLLAAAVMFWAAYSRWAGPVPRENPLVVRLRVRATAGRSGPDPLRRFYARRAFAPAWNDRATRESLLGALRDAAAHGLDPHAYDVERFQAVTESDDDRAAADDVALTEAFLRYGADLLRGRKQPAKDAAEPELSAKLEAAIEGHDAAAALDRLPPQHEGYQRLREALVRYRAIVDAGGWPVLDEAATQLTARLAAERARDLRELQRRHGLEPSGRLDSDTLRELAVPADARVRQIEMNLERWRRMPHDFGKRYIVVNLAAYLLAAYDAGTRVLDMKVIIGKQYAPTPIFADSITYLIFNPYWNIPDSIERDEIRPKGAAFMKREGIEVDSRGRLRQRPGPKNPLGRVKFVFPNRFEVYLHDTPKDELFERRQRDLSHGCVRVEKPVELAEFALAPAGWTRQQILATSASGETKAVDLSEPIPVYILYWTAWVDDDGGTEFRADVYDYDGGLARELGAV